MKSIAFIAFLTLSTVVASASPVNTFALVVDSGGAAGKPAETVHSGQRLPASSELSVPNGSTPVDLQLTGDATFADANASPMTGSAMESLVRVEPGSTLSLAKLQATDTGIGTLHRINLQLIHGSVLVSARRLPEPSSFNLVAGAGRVSIAEGTVKVSAHSIAVAAGEAVFYPNGTDSKSASPVVLTSGHCYDTDTHALSLLSSAKRSAMEHQTREFHPVGPAHVSWDDDHTEDCVSPVHSGHHHHRHHRHHRPPHRPNPSNHGQTPASSPAGFQGHDSSNARVT